MDILRKISLRGGLDAVTGTEIDGIQISFQNLGFAEVLFENDRVIGLCDLTRKGTLLHFIRQIEVSGQLLCDGTGAADGAAAQYRVFDRAEDTDNVEAVMGFEGFILQRDEGVLYILWNLVNLNNRSILIREDVVDDFPLVIIEHGALRKQTVDVARFNFRRFDDNHADVSHAEQRDCQNYAYDKLQELLLVEFVFFLFVMFLTAVVRRGFRLRVLCAARVFSLRAMGHMLRFLFRGFSLHTSCASAVNDLICVRIPVLRLVRIIGIFVITQTIHPFS